MTERLVSVAVPVPLYTAFDYRIPPGAAPAPGARVRVPFGNRSLIGVVVQAAHELPATDLAERYKCVDQVLDPEPPLSAAMLGLATWIADYYHHPIGEVIAAMLPGVLRRGDPAELPREPHYRLSEGGRRALDDLPKRARSLRLLLQTLHDAPAPLPRPALAGISGATAKLRRALDDGWVERADAPADAPAPAIAPVATLPALTADQQAAVSALADAGPGFGVHLLQGVTGSGKTEVYLRAIADTVAAGRQALLLVPEIGLTPQLLDRVRERFGDDAVAGYHSGLSEAARGRVWLRAHAGRLPIVVGTRSAVLLSLPRLALIIVDEEHDASFKQQDGLRYSARDLAVLRGQREQARVILGSATPSLESLHRVDSGRYALLRLPRRVHSQQPPRMQLLDVRKLPLRNGLSPTLEAAIERHLGQGGQVLLFINRRGYAPSVICHDCGWTAACRHCDARMTLHGRGRLICHHCGTRQMLPPACPQCRSRQLRPVGQGTERVEEGLRQRFPAARVERFDSDRLRSLRALQTLLDDTRAGRVNILVGTQMLAKGHDFAGLSLVGIVDADQALFSVDFRALERMGQLMTQVAGRAGRAGQAGEVLVQTHQPEHAALQSLIGQGYDGLATLLKAERAQAGLPPYTHLALLRAEAKTESLALQFLELARGSLPAGSPVDILGPVPAPMERRAGRYRAQLLLQSPDRAGLHRLLTPWVRDLDSLPGARGVRWSIDVDPQDLY